MFEIESLALPVFAHEPAFEIEYRKPALATSVNFNNARTNINFVWYKDVLMDVVQVMTVFDVPGDQNITPPLPPIAVSALRPGRFQPPPPSRVNTSYYGPQALPPTVTHPSDVAVPPVLAHPVSYGTMGLSSLDSRRSLNHGVLELAMAPSQPTYVAAAGDKSGGLSVLFAPDA